MRTIFSKKLAVKLVCALFISAATVACTQPTDSAAGAAQAKRAAAVTSRIIAADEFGLDGLTGERSILRYRVDAIKARAWALTRDGVDLYRLDSHEKIAHITLPGWLWADEPYVCAPDLALGARGAVFVTSNVTTTIWRIDPDELSVTRHEAEIDNQSGREIGFTGLVYDPEQAAYFAVSELYGALWRIDAGFKRAQIVALSAPLPKTCGLKVLPRTSAQRSSHFGALCVEARGSDWVVNLSRDRLAGNLSPGDCGSRNRTGTSEPSS